MHRILFNLYGYEVSVYSFFTILALFIVSSGIYFFGIQRGFHRRQLVIAITAMAISAFVGARLLHIITNWELYSTEHWRILRIDFTGFSIYGGILMAMIAAIISARLLMISIWRLGDTAAPFLGLGIVSMRIGCFLNGCCFGHATNLPWGVTFPFMSQAHSHQLSLDPAHLFYVSPVHPTQLYELGYALLATIMAVIIIRYQHSNSQNISSPETRKALSFLDRRLPDGLAILVFGIIYTIGRLINLHFRVMPPTMDATNFFYPTLYGGMIILIIFLIFTRFRSININ